MEGPPRSALLCQLDPKLQAELRIALSHSGLDIRTYTCSEVSECSRISHQHRPDILFCQLSEDFQAILSSLRRDVPVIVVSRVPDTHEWITAMEAGASDYCAPPFETNQLRWILNSGQHSPLLRATVA